MKKQLRILQILLFLVSTNYIFSQELMNYYIEPKEDNTITLQTLVYNNTFSSFGSSSIAIVDNTITLTLCYLNTSGQSVIHDFQSFDIDLPLGYDNYTVNIDLYGDNDAVLPCSLENLVEIGTINFDFPYKPTATTYIPDNVFEDFIEDLGFGDDIANNDLVFTHRIINLRNLFLNNMTQDIFSMEGLQDFISLKDLRCSNHQISDLDVSENILLENLFCSNNDIDNLDVSNNLNLKRLWCDNNNLTTITFLFNINLEKVELRNNQLLSIDISNNINLSTLHLFSNQLNSINITNNSLLEILGCSNNFINELNVSNNINLKELYFGNNYISEIDLTNLSFLESLDTNNCLLSFLNTSFLPNLKILTCVNNPIESLNLNSNTQLETIWVSSNASLNSLYLKNGNNQNITSLLVNDNDNLFCLEVDNPEEAPYSGWSVDNQVIFSEDCSLTSGENSLVNSINFYPNPVQSTLNMTTNNNLQINQIQVYDVIGKLLLEKEYTQQINISHLASGVLFVKIQTNKGVLVKKVVKK